MTAFGDEGWTYGTIVHTHSEPDKWLTVWGSHWHAPVLHPTQAAAKVALTEWLNEVNRDPGQFVVRRVRMVFHGGVESGRAFLVLPVCGYDGYVCEDCGVRAGFPMDFCCHRATTGASQLVDLGEEDGWEYDHG